MNKNTALWLISHTFKIVKKRLRISEGYIFQFYSKEVFKIFNIGQNICRLFHLLEQFLFTTSETELDYYQQKVNVQVAS